jgi:aminopeptidase N
MRFASLLLLTALGCSADTYPRQAGVDAVHYEFRVSVSDDSDEIRGEATAEIRFLSDGVKEFWLDLGPAMKVSAVTPAVRFTREGERLVISLDQPSKAGELRRFTVTYQGVPAGGLYSSNNSHGDKGIFSANWPNLAHQWLAIIDHPYDKATSEFMVTAPAKYQVVANGLLQEERDLGDGSRLTHWKQGQPIASWLNALGIAQFAVRNFGRAGGVPLQTWVPYQDRESGIATFEKPTREAMEFLSDHVGPYPYEKLANIWAWSPGFSGGTEHASAIFYSCCKSSNQVVWHEIAHQWFGDAVTEKDWDDVWLSEGFATYFTHLTREHYEGRDAFVAGLQADRPRILEAEAKSPGEAVVHNNLADMGKVLFSSPLIYQKGGWVLHMLRGQVGTENFWRGIREYYRLYRDSNASTADFQRVMEAAAGQELDWFFTQWLHGSPSPALQGSWRYNGASKRIEVDLTQTQSGGAYKLPIELSTGGRLEMTQKQQHFEVTSDKDPGTLVLDPNTWLLADIRLERR